MNLKHAREMIITAAKGRDANTKPELVVLPVGPSRSRAPVCLLIFLLQEVFNSPYGATFFPKYAETIAYTPGEEYDVDASESESVKMLSAAAKEAGVWLLGGVCDY